MFDRTTLFERKPSYVGQRLLYLLPGDLRHLTVDAMQRELHNFPVSRLAFSVEEFITTFHDEETEQETKPDVPFKFLFVLVLFMTLSLNLM